MIILKKVKFKWSTLGRCSQDEIFPFAIIRILKEKTKRLQNDSGNKSELNNFPFTVAENGLLVWQLDFVTILFLVPVGFETERKKSHKAQLDTQLNSNILKQVCKCGRTLISNNCVVYVVYSVIVTNSIFLLQQLTSPAWAFAFLAFRSL